MEDNKVYIDQDLEILIPGYLENREEDIEKIKGLISEQNFDKIRVIGHSMKGSGGGYGFDYITEIGREIETAAGNKKISKIEESVNDLEKYLNEVEIEYIEK